MAGMNEVLVMEDLRARLQADPGKSAGDKKHQRAGRQEAEMMDLREKIALVIFRVWYVQDCNRWIMRLTEMRRSETRRRRGHETRYCR